MNAAAMKFLGENEWACRVWPAATAAGTAAIAFLLAERRFGPRAGFLSGALLGTSLLWFALAQINLIDMALAFFLGLALLGLLRGVQGDRDGYLLAYTGMALAVLAKGLIGLVLPAGVLLLWAILARRPRVLLEALHIPGILLFLVLTLPWFVAVSLRNPDFAWFFFVHEHFLRYSTTLHDRWQPFWFFAPIVLLGFLPWSGTALAGLWDGLTRLRGLRRRAGDYLSSWGSPVEEPQEALFLLLWFGVIFLFFSLSQSKLIPYILPALPPLAALAGIRLDRILDEGDRRGMILPLSLDLFLCGVLAAALWLIPGHQDDYPAYLIAAISRPAAIVLTVGILAAAAAFVLRGPGATAGVLLLLAVLLGAALKPGFDFYGQVRSPRNLALQVAPLLRPEHLLVDYGDLDQAWPFYLKRRMAVVEGWGELDFGRRAENTQGWFLSREEFLTLWRGDRTLVCLIRRGAVEALKREPDFPFWVLARDPLYEDKLVISNRPLRASR
jgi:4-amino-4-deoxy-L-arabinose transferase-like glycosyltransferase